MYLRTYVSEERGDGEGPGSEELFLRHTHLTKQKQKD